MMFSDLQEKIANRLSIFLFIQGKVGVNRVKIMSKILLVDDDQTLHIVLRSYLEHKGYEVYSVYSGQEGLDVFANYHPDLIISDVAMPEMNGIEFCREVRSTPNGTFVPFLFLSGRDDVEDRIQGHSSGADDYIIKPFDIKEVLAKIERQISRSNNIQLEISRLKEQITIQGSETLNNSTIITQKTVKEKAELTPLPLTPAEEKVFREVIQGLTNKQISEHLFISPRTVQTHLSNILGKLQLDNRSQLVRFAYEKGYSVHSNKD